MKNIKLSLTLLPILLQSNGYTGFLIWFSLTGQSESWLPFFATIVTERGVTSCQPDSSGLYRALLEQTMPYLAGTAEEPPLPMPILIEPELCALAAERSRTEGNRPVPLSELRESDSGYNGQTFAQGYRRARYPQ